MQSADVKTASPRLCALLAALIAAAMLPAVPHYQLDIAPAWAQITLCIGGLLLAYVAWVATAPNRFALWFTTWMLALAATACVLTMATILFTSPGASLPLQIAASRAAAITWSIAMATVLSAASLIAGRAANRW